MSKTPIDAMLDKVDWRCTVCKTPSRIGCNCWTRCDCGYSYRTGTRRRNDVHGRWKNLRIIVCGGRDYNDRQGVFINLDVTHEMDTIVEIIEGGASGADALAREWAKNNNVKLTTCPADWKKHGRKAGPIRNREMLALKPDFVFAFPGGRGTADMMRAAWQAGVEIYEPIKAEQELLKDENK
jgi:hypothetical protein